MLTVASKTRCTSDAIPHFLDMMDIGAAMPRSLFTHTLLLLLVARACTVMSIQGHSAVQGTSLSCSCSSKLHPLAEVVDCPQVRPCRGKSLLFSVSLPSTAPFWFLGGPCTTCVLTAASQVLWLFARLTTLLHTALCVCRATTGISMQYLLPPLHKQSFQAAAYPTVASQSPNQLPSSTGHFNCHANQLSQHKHPHRDHKARIIQQPKMTNCSHSQTG